MKKYKVLIVDDEDLLRDGLKEMLQLRGPYEVYVADDGITALTELRKNPMDLLITDVNMKQMNGFTLIENIKKENLNCPKILVMTGYTNNLELAENKPMVSGVIPKPFKGKEFISKIETSLEMSKAG